MTDFQFGFHLSFLSFISYFLCPFFPFISFLRLFSYCGLHQFGQTGDDTRETKEEDLNRMADEKQQRPRDNLGWKAHTCTYLRHSLKGCMRILKYNNNNNRAGQKLWRYRHKRARKSARGRLEKTRQQQHIFHTDKHTGELCPPFTNLQTSS